MHRSDYWSVQTGNKSPSKTHRAGFHTNHSIWTQQIAGFGSERPSQIPSLISKRPPKTINTHTRSTHNTHCLPFTLPLQHGPTSSAPCSGKKVGLVSLSLHVWERDEHQWDNQRGQAIHWCHPGPSLLYLLKEWQNRSWGGVKRKILTKLLFMGRGFSFQGSFIEAFPNTSSSLSALTSANQRAWVQVFGETLEDFGHNSQWVHSGSGLKTMVTWLHCQCVVFRGGETILA